MPSARFTGAAGVQATASNLTGLNATTGVTVAWWMRPDAESPLVAADVFAQASTANTSRDGYSLGINSTGGLVLRVYGSAGATDAILATNLTRCIHNQWVHYAVTFDDAADAVWFYRNGMLVNRTTNTRDMTANASCVTRLAGTNYSSQFGGSLFDVQVLPDVVVPPGDIPLLMNPAVKYPGVKGRYCGRNFTLTTIALRDESGNGNDLTATNTGTTWVSEEPPLSPTLA